MNTTVSTVMLIVGIVLFIVGIGIIRGPLKSWGRFWLGFILLALGISLAAAAFLIPDSPKQHAPPGRLECTFENDGCAIVPTKPGN